MTDWLKRALADFPTTPARILFTLWLSGWTAVVMWWCFVRRIALDEAVVNSWLIFLAAMSGLDVTQWVWKRKTAWAPPVTESESGRDDPPPVTITAVSAPQSRGTAPQSPQPAPGAVRPPQPPMVPADGSEEG